MARSKAKRVKMPNGAGSIVLRSDGRYMARYTAEDPETGGKVRKALYGKTDQEVRRKLIAVLNQRQLGTLVVTHGRTLRLRVYLERWLATKQARPKTLHRYQELLEVHVVPRLGALPLPKLEPHHVNRLLASKHAGGLSARTCNHMRAVLRNALHDAARVAMEVLGHSQISTTMDIYTKVYPELQREAARAIDKVLDPDGAV